MALLIAPSSANAAFDISAFSAVATAEGGAPATQAGSHPAALNLQLGFDQAGALAAGDLKDLSLELPPGLIENPTAVPQCTQADFLTPRSSPFEASRSGESCPDRTQIGVVSVESSNAGQTTRSFGVFNLSPPPGVPSQFGFNPYGAPVIFAPSLRQADGEYGLTLESKNFSQLFATYGLGLTIWGTPWSILHNTQRGNCLNEAEPGFGWAKCQIGRPRDNPATAYLTMPTSCDGPLVFAARATSWQQLAPVARSSQGPTLQGCGQLPFDPRPYGRLSNPRASSASGYEFEIEVDASGVTDPQRLAPSAVRKAVVRLPEGVSINPSVGAGLGVCTAASYAAETPTSPPDAGCPNESKIGDVTVRSPLFDQPIAGSLFLAAPYDNPFGSLIAIYLIAKSADRGILVKVAGELRADPRTGSLTATFDRLPQLPYSSLNVHFREGQRSPLATPAACGALSAATDLTAWRDPALTRHTDSPAPITAGIGGGPCPSGLAPFTPRASGGSLNPNAGSYSPFYLHLTRTDVEQEITSYSATFPPGLLARIAAIPYCPDAAIAAASRRSGVAERDDPSCPQASRIGRTVSGYGLGPVLSFAPGGLYLAGPYRGSSFSVVAIDSALVGPFDLGVIVVRSAIRIDPQTAQASIDATGTDPIPHIVDGIPIHLSDIRAYIDRPDFTLNPTSCAASSISSALNGAGVLFGQSADDTLATATAPYQAFNCSALGFRPRISLRLRGGTERADRPSLRVVVKPRPREANIALSQVTLPPSLFLNQAHIRGICTKAQFAAGRCPPASVYGHVRAYTPLLAEPMQGPAYLRSSDNTLPDLVFALRGHGIEVDLVGRIDSFQGGLRGTFAALPDAPVTKFVLTMAGGRHGLLENAADLCAAPQIARARFLGHSNRGWILHQPLKADCAHHNKHRKRKANS